jgi:hypothetical protein
VCGLVQFPYAVPIYLCYVVPLIVLTATALYRYLPPITNAIPAAILAFLIGFAVLRTNASEVTTFGNAFVPYPPVAPLQGDRGGLNVRADAAELYNRLIARLHQHARGEYTWASPDTPEIYFLAGLKNPTRSLFEFFDDTTHRTERILTSLDRHGVTAIVLNSQPAFSPPITRGMYRELISRFPQSENIGFFQLRWRE